MKSSLHWTGASDEPEKFRVNWRKRSALIEFIQHALRASGCEILSRSVDGIAPFRVSFVAPTGERLGILAYAFLANTRVTKNRPSDEWRFQVKYGSKDGRERALWQDRFGLYTTLFVGIDPECGFFVGADPVLNSPTKFFISKEFKQAHVDQILQTGWHAWEREQTRESSLEPHEVLVGGTGEHFLRYVRFEREVLAEDQGHRQLVAERFATESLVTGVIASTDSSSPNIPAARLHELEREFQLSKQEILELISTAPRLKMAVRGWVAQKHLESELRRLPEIAEVESIERDGQPDFRVRVRGGRRPVLVECKNVLRPPDKAGRARLDFERTRVSKGDPCTRYYSPDDFDVVAACLHARTEQWEFAACQTAGMAPHRACPGKLDHRVLIDETWSRDLGAILVTAAS